MKSLQVIAGLGTGGAETQLVNLATAERAGAPECVVVNLMAEAGGPNEARLREGGIETHHLGLTGLLTLARTQRRLARLIRRYEPDVVQSWMYYADIISLSALRCARRRGTTRLYWGVRCSDMDLGRYGKRLRRAVTWCAKRSALPDGIVVNSAAGRDAHVAIGYRPRAWHLIENGIDTARFAPGDRAKLRHQLGLPAAGRIAVHAARVDPMKDHATLLKIARSCSDWTFVAVGQGTDALDGPGNYLGLGRQEAIERFYAAADVILSTSAFGEGFSNVIAEGMACEAVPVATDVGDARRIVGETGYISAPGDADGLARNLDRRDGAEGAGRNAPGGERPNPEGVLPGTHGLAFRLASPDRKGRLGMCGIAALVQPGRRFRKELLDAIDTDLFHRGPDAGGQLSETGIGMVHRRLAILDPTEGANQPMEDPQGFCSLVYNGEIYNYRAVRAELEQAGITLRTDGDTEALLMGYLQWGEAVLDRLEGMYAFALYDRRDNRLIAARDPLGIKPLYLYRRDGFAMVASEVRPMRHVTALEPDPAALAELINYRWAAGRLSNFKGIDRVPGGTIVSISLADGSVEERRFCDPLETLCEEAMTEAEAEERARAAVLSSIEAHLASDVGYTMQLSGGVDSSLIASVTARHTEGRLESFALHLPGYEHDEKRWRDTLLGAHNFVHEEVTIGGRDFADALPRAVAHMEGPSPHLGCVLLMRLCDTITQHGKVVLTGEGADEFFGGYLRYARWPKTALQERLARWLPAGMLPDRWPFAGIRRIAGVDAAAFGGVYHDIQAMRRMFPELTPAPGAREAVSARFGRFVDRLFAVDQSAYLESLLLRQDKMAMAASVEARVPFVHMPLARVMNRIPRRLLVPGDGRTKPLLKRIAEDYVPHEILYRRKVGLRLPTDEWLSDEGALGRFLPDLTEPGARLADFANPGGLQQAVDDFRNGRPGADQIVMQLVNLETWLRNIPPTPAARAAA